MFQGYFQLSRRISEHAFLNLNLFEFKGIYIFVTPPPCPRRGEWGIFILLSFQLTHSVINFLDKKFPRPINMTTVINVHDDLPLNISNSTFRDALRHYQFARLFYSKQYYLPFNNCKSNINAEHFEMLTQCASEVWRKFVLIKAVTTPIFDNPNHVQTNSGLLSIIRATASPFRRPAL